MTLPPPLSTEPSAGHYRTAGQAVSAMGLLAVALYLLANWVPLELGFFRRTDILLISGLYFAVGGLLLATARRGSQP